MAPPSRPRGWAVVVAGLLGPMLSPPPAAAQVSFQVNRIQFVRAIGTPTENCQALRAVLGAITDGTPVWDADPRPYEVRLEPGRYACGSVPVFLPEGVMLVGSSPLQTTIEGSVDDANFGVVHLVNGTGLANVHVDNTLAVPTLGGIAVSVYQGDQAPSVRIEGSVLSGSVLPPNALALHVVNGAVAVWTTQLNGTVKNDDASVGIWHSTLLGLQEAASASTICHGCTAPNGEPLTKDCL